MPHAFPVQEKQKQDAAAANGKAPRQSAGELRVQKGANDLFQLFASGSSQQPTDQHPTCSSAVMTAWVSIVEQMITEAANTSSLAIHMRCRYHGAEPAEAGDHRLCGRQGQAAALPDHYAPRGGHLQVGSKHGKSPLHVLHVSEALSL